VEGFFAFYGGRTEAFTLFQKDQDISYVDATSLYPYINKTGKIPIGHPEIVTEGFTDIQQYEGLIKCKILPPRGLYIPVLPVKMNKKLLATETCQHNDEERSLTGTWVTDELKKALEKGYVVQRIYEVWHFDETEQYDPKTYFIRGMLDLCPNFPQTLFSISLANVLNPGFFFMLL
jgi:hypothetical protein